MTATEIAMKMAASRAEAMLAMQAVKSAMTAEMLDSIALMSHPAIILKGDRFEPVPPWEFWKGDDGDDLAVALRTALEYEGL